MSEPSELSVESLRRLARGLLFSQRDPARAEDVVQEAWLAALQRDEEVQELASWLAGAVRRLARNALRDEGRRGERERWAARPEAQESAAETSARIEVLRRLVEALDALEEPYRTAIVQRYLEDLPPRVIARRLGLPVNTVRTHVRRGLGRLREKLDGEGGRNRQEFLAALLPLAGEAPWTLGIAGPSSSVPAAGVALMKHKFALGVVLALVLAVTWRTVSSLRREEAPRVETGRALAALGERTAGAAHAEPREDELAATGPSERRPAAAEAASSSATWIVRGHVTRGTHDAFADAPLVGRVYANLLSEEEPVLERRFSADAAGDFEWELEPPSVMVKVTVGVDRPDRLGQDTWGYFLPGDPPPERWKIDSFALDCTVRGRVLDPRGHPVAGARVVHGYWEEDGHSALDGSFALRAPANFPSGKIRVIASGHAQASLELGELAPGERTLPDIVLAPELRVRGRVVDELGNPLEGAVVSADHPHDRLPAVTSDAAGAFEIGGLDPTSEHTAFTAFREGFLRGHARLPEDPAASIELCLARGVRVRGRVLTEEGTPVAGAYVHAGPFAWNEPEDEEWAWSDAGGVFELARLAPGTQHVWVQRRGFAHLRREVQVPAGAELHGGVELVLERGHTLGGVILGASGEPLPWGMIYAEQAGYRHPRDFAGVQTHAGSDGRFRLEDLPALELTVGALAPGHARLEQRVTELDRDDLVLRPEPRAAMAGRVVDAASGAPVTSFRVRPGFSPRASEDQQPGGWPASWSAGVLFDSTDGSWRLADDFAAGKLFRIEIEAEGFAPAVLDPLVTALDPDPDASVARLVRGTLVRGRVVERASGAPLDGARVRAFRDEEELRWADSPAPEARTDAGGRFELVNLPVGPITLAVDHGEHGLVLDGPFEVGAHPGERWIELGSGARVRGRLLDAAGDGLAGETVSVWCLEGPEKHRQRETTTGADGAYELRGLAAGDYHLRWQRRRDEVQVNDLLQLVTLVADQTLELDLRPTGRTTVRGTIRFEGELPALVSVLFMPETQIPADWDGKEQLWARSGRATFAENGAFELEHLEAGRWNAVVTFQLPDLAHALGGSGFFDVPEEGVVDVVIEAQER